ncbi:DUF6913 domain-containing protein [Namhaeicola litoreus]|uniref:DUF6913 domain-containing protein n=1 Tax=Namhaeicola litoreus TaxID=1052145 RepID=A0ABW3Y4Z2_9FLAO
MKSLFHKIIKKDLHRERSGIFLETKIEKISVLMDEHQFDSKDILEDLQKKIGVKLKSDYILVYSQQKKPETSDACRFFTKSDFGIFGKIKNLGLVDFLSNDFDILINYCSPDSDEARTILLKTKAKLVAGFDDNQALQDFSFKLDRSNLIEFNTELARYLKKFELI